MKHILGKPFSIPNPTFEHLQASAISDVLTLAESIRKKATGRATEREIAAWPNKAERARRVVNGSATPADVAAVEAEVETRGKGETVQDLVTIQLGKEVLYATLVGTIDGLVVQAETALSATKNQAELEATVVALLAKADAKMIELGLK